MAVALCLNPAPNCHVANMLNPIRAEPAVSLSSFSNAEGLAMSASPAGASPAAASPASISLSSFSNAGGLAMSASPAGASPVSSYAKIYKPNPDLSRCKYPTKTNYRLVGLPYKGMAVVDRKECIKELEEKQRHTLLSDKEELVLRYFRHMEDDRVRKREERDEEQAGLQPKERDERKTWRRQNKSDKRKAERQQKKRNEEKAGVYATQ
jgi:hypothetical protein